MSSAIAPFNRQSEPVPQCHQQYITLHSLQYIPQSAVSHICSKWNEMFSSTMQHSGPLERLVKNFGISCMQPCTYAHCTRPANIIRPQHISNTAIIVKSSPYLQAPGHPNLSVCVLS